MKNACPLFLLGHVLKFFIAMRSHTGEKPAQLHVLLECSHPTNLVCNANPILSILMATCVQFLHCHENTYQCETCMTAGALQVYIYPTNRIVCIEKLIIDILMVIFAAMRAHTGKKPANLQVLSGFIHPKPRLLVLTNIFPLV